MARETDSENPFGGERASGQADREGHDPKTVPFSVPPADDLPALPRPPPFCRGTLRRVGLTPTTDVLNLPCTKNYATETATVANKMIEVGNFVQPGQVLFSTVPNKLYVTANYKETQPTTVRAGQPVTIRIDAFPELRLHGHVDSISARNRLAIRCALGGHADRFRRVGHEAGALSPWLHRGLERLGLKNGAVGDAARACGAQGATEQDRHE
jgi:hypothetical protein